MRYQNKTTDNLTAETTQKQLIKQIMPENKKLEFPHGIYCSCPRTSADGKSQSVIPEVARKDFVDGIFVRVYWSDLEPVDGKYSWDLIDSQIKKARQYNKKVSLAILNGPRAPEWLYSEGAQSVEYSVQLQKVKMPLPWDHIYLTKWSELIKEFGTRYNNNESVTLIHMTTATKNGLEMQLPEEIASKPDFSFATIIKSTKEIMDVYSKYFPDKYLDIDLHPVIKDDTVSQQIANYGHENIGERFGVFAAWWSDKNTETYKGQFELLKDSARKSFGTIQLSSSESSRLSNFAKNNIDVKKSINLALSSDIRYFEIWNNDLLNSEFESYFRSIEKKLIERNN